MKLPLWLRSDDSETVTLARCRNCGHVKAASDPCGFDHLAALMEFRAWLDSKADAETRLKLDRQIQHEIDEHDDDMPGYAARVEGMQIAQRIVRGEGEDA